MTSRGKLLVRGSINIDEFFVVDHIVKVGETISSKEYSRRAGGKGANQAVSAAKAGATVELAATLGNDGAWLKETLASYGVSQSLLAVDGTLPTGRAVIQLSHRTADNSIVLLPGSNFSSLPSPFSQLSPSDLSSSFSHLLLQNEIPFESTQQALREAHQAGLVTIFNPSPMLTKEQLEGFEWDELDWLIINEGEGEELVKVLAPNAANAEGILRSLREKLKGLTGIIMTMGSQGVQADLKDGKRIVSVGAGKVEEGGVKDTTGAGDCFTGYFATLLSTLPRGSSPLKENKLEEILKISCQAAAMCCEKPGAMESVPTLAEVKERLGSNWIAGQEWDALLV
ncbi:putative ribokinase [Sporobolomyces salmoneus]|uniref:putative ribokinase n=1 Tax=Sporobolomyces salmoneus TaxID=183962 RepID=UPI00317953BD